MISNTRHLHTLTIAAQRVIIDLVSTMRAAFRKYPMTGPFLVALERHVPRLDGEWHFHEEFELVYIIRGAGQRYVGDSIEPFASGDLCLMGPRMAHTYSSSAALNQRACSFVVVHASGTLLLPDDASHVELAPVRRLLTHADHGIVFTGRTRRTVAARLRSLPVLPPLLKLAAWLQILDRLANAPDSEHRLLSMVGSKTRAVATTPSIERVRQHLDQQPRQPPSLSQAAKMAAMSRATFSRAFRRSLGRSYARYLIEIRIRRACQLLVDTDLPISQVARDCGFANPPYFSRRFRAEQKMPPIAYRETMRRQARRVPADRP